MELCLSPGLCPPSWAEDGAPDASWSLERSTPPTANQETTNKNKHTKPQLLGCRNQGSTVEGFVGFFALFLFFGKKIHKCSFSTSESKGPGNTVYYRVPCNELQCLHGVQCCLVSKPEKLKNFHWKTLRENSTMIRRKAHKRWNQVRKNAPCGLTDRTLRRESKPGQSSCSTQPANPRGSLQMDTALCVPGGASEPSLSSPFQELRVNWGHLS